MNAPLLTTKLSLNQQALVQTLKKAFDNKVSVIKECAQNARRAGATKVHLYFCKERKFFAVVDNGCGIADFDQLLAIAQSGWSTEIKQKETPYGLGFLSCLYTATDITVISQGKKLNASTDNVLSFQDLEIETCQSHDKTIVVMRGEGMDALFNADFEKIFRGFAIPVYVNNKPMKREHALVGTLTFTESDHGYFSIAKRLSGAMDNQCLDVASDAVYYYQGFQIYVDAYYKDNASSFCHVIHINGEKYDAVAPDRTKLIDEVESIKSLKEVLKTMIRDDLINSVSSIDEDVVLNSYSLLSKYGVSYLLNQFDKIPKSWLCTYDEYPILNSNEEGSGFNGYCAPAKHVARQEFIDRACNVFAEKPESFDWDDANFVFHMYAWKLQGYWLDEALPENHWLKPLLLDSALVTIKDVEGLREPSISQRESGLHNGHIMMCDQYTITGPMGDALFTEDAIRIVHENRDTVLVPKNEKSSFVSMQTNSYQGEYDYDQTEENYSADAFLTWMDNERSANDPRNLLLLKMQEFGRLYPTLRGNCFSIQIDAEGEVIVKNVI
jgi:hypothetical protein